MGGGRPDVDGPRGRVGVSSEWVSVRRRGPSRQQRLLGPGDGGLRGDLRPSPGHLD